MNTTLSGWRKDPHKVKDYIYAPPKKLAEDPSFFSLETYAPAVRDQGNLGSCTGFGVGGNITGALIMQAGDDRWFSPTWIYNGARLIEGSLPYDDGAYPRDCFDFILKNGCLPERFHPYNDTLDKTDPTKWPESPEALKYPITRYERITGGVDNICSAIASGHMVSLGSDWYSEWMSVGPDGVMPEVDASSYIVGGHETFLLAYDKVRKSFLLQNSWGKTWGNNGRAWLPFSAFDKFLEDDGYDAHVVYVDWATTPPEPPAPVPPTPKIPIWVWIVGAAVLAIALYLIFK